MVQCAKTERQCLNSCSGVDNSDLNYDFHTIVGITELGVISLGAEGHAAAEANCSIKSTILEVPAFGGGTAFATFAARLRVRSGMSAISSAWCTKSPLSCGVIQRTLERSPGLVYVNGAFRHRYDLVPPSPPPPPDPPPITLRYGPDPPSPPPPPLSPPPYFINAEECIPLPSLSYFGLDDTIERVDDAISEERASCLFVRRVVDERRRVSSCFALVADPHPPPPPYMSSSSRSGELNLRLQRDRLGELEEYKAPRKTDRAKWNADTSNAIAKTQALIDSLGENDPILRAMLRDAIGEMEAAGPQGRRLLERNDYEIKMTDALIHDDLVDEYGRDGIPGVTVGSCEALCEASRQDANRTDERECGAYAFKRQNPHSYTDLTGRCWLLQHAGACKTADFGIELYTRSRNLSNCARDRAI